MFQLYAQEQSTLSSKDLSSFVINSVLMTKIRNKAIIINLLYLLWFVSQKNIISRYPQEPTQSQNLIDLKN